MRLLTATLGADFRRTNLRVVVAVQLHCRANGILRRTQPSKGCVWVGKLSALDFRKGYSRHTGKQTLDKLLIAHFQAVDSYYFALLGDVFHYVHCHCRLTYAGTSRKYDKFAAVKSVGHTVETTETRLYTAIFAGVDKAFVDGVHRARRVVGKGDKTLVCAALRQVEDLFFRVGDCFLGAATAVCLLLHLAANADKLAHGARTLDNGDVLVVVGGTRQQFV